MKGEPRIPFHKNSHFYERFVAQRTLIQTILKNPEVSREQSFHTSSRRGFYMVPLPESFLISAQEKPGLPKMATHFATMIEAIKEKKEGSVLVCDVGTYEGETLGHLADHFSKTGDIESGKVVLIGTSLTNKPEWMNAKVGDNPLVHHIKGDALDIMDAKVFVNGKETPIFGNIDLLFEFVSATFWSLVPEVERYIFAQSLSDFGIYYSFGSPGSHEYNKERQAGNALVRQKIQEQFGLIPVYMIESGQLTGVKIHPNYEIHRKELAPLIHVD